MYNRPGEFPVVHFKKSELTYSRPRRSLVNSPKIKIPAPGLFNFCFGGFFLLFFFQILDTSIYQTSTRSEILRTGSLLSKPLGQGTHQELNREHESMAPLDALKEISRKRIHCDVSVLIF